MYAGNNLGYVYISSDSGHTWSSTSGYSGSSSALRYGMACSADGTKVFAPAYNGYIQMSSNGGTTWTNITDSSSRYWKAIACTADGSKFYAAVYGGAIFQWSGSGLSLYYSGSVNWTALACSGDGTGVAAAYGNTISTTGGANYTLAGNCAALVVSADGLKMVAAYNGGVVGSTNSGANWAVMTNAPAINWSCLAGSSDCTRLVGGASNGLFYASANFGATWTALTATNQFWADVVVSADGTKFATATSTVSPVTGNIFYSSASAQPNVSTTNTICGSQGAAVELQYIGNNQFMPVSSSGILWAN
jgi:hypothetical protein